MLNSIDNIVTLNVDTRNINIGNIDDCCDFGQDKSKISNRDFTTALNLRDTTDPDPKYRVIWKATPIAQKGVEGCDDIVDITAIWFKSDVDGIHVVGNFKQKSRGEIYGFPQKLGMEDFYLFFKVYNMIGGKEVLRGIYYIDPKIVVNP